jgi:hypothetical protein
LIVGLVTRTGAFSFMSKEYTNFLFICYISNKILGKEEL